MLDLIHFLLFSLRGTGTLRAHNLFFSIVNEIYEYYEAQSAISLFKNNELSSHHFRGLKIEICDPCNVRKPIRFTNISNEYVSIFLTST